MDSDEDVIENITNGLVNQIIESTEFNWYIGLWNLFWLILKFIKLSHIESIKGGFYLVKSKKLIFFCISG